MVVLMEKAGFADTVSRRACRLGNYTGRWISVAYLVRVSTYCGAAASWIAACLCARLLVLAFYYLDTIM